MLKRKHHCIAWQPRKKWHSESAEANHSSEATMNIYMANYRMLLRGSPCNRLSVVTAEEHLRKECEHLTLHQPKPLAKVCALAGASSLKSLLTVGRSRLPQNALGVLAGGQLQRVSATELAITCGAMLIQRARPRYGTACNHAHL